MTDLKNGILDIDGFAFHAKTTIKDVKNYFGEKICVTELNTGFKVKFNSPYYISSNIYAYAFDFNNEGFLTNYSLIPVAPPTIIDQGYGEIPKYKLKLAKQWLRNLLPVAPQTLNENEARYTFDVVEYYASLQQDVRYGIVGGDIIVSFHKV